MHEEWRVIKDYPDYEVSNRGRVRSYKRRGPGSNRWDTPVLMTLGAESYGHLHVNLYNDEGYRQVYVHVLVLEAFIGPCPKGQECRHLDGVPSHNDVRNLCWGTHKENVADMIRHGTAHQFPIGMMHYRAAVPTKEVIDEIQERFAESESVRSIANDFPSFSYKIVCAIANGTHWSVRDSNV